MQRQRLLAETSHGVCEFAGVSQDLVDDEGNESDHERCSEGEEVTRHLFTCIKGAMLSCIKGGDAGLGALWQRTGRGGHLDVENTLVLPQKRRFEAAAHVFCMMYMVHVSEVG